MSMFAADSSLLAWKHMVSRNKCRQSPEKDGLAGSQKKRTSQALTIVTGPFPTRLEGNLCPLGRSSLDPSRGSGANHSKKHTGIDKLESQSRERRQLSKVQPQTSLWDRTTGLPLKMAMAIAEQAGISKKTQRWASSVFPRRIRGTREFVL